MKTLITSLLIVVIIKSPLMAQDALWQLDFDKEIEWTKITDVGILLIGTSDMTLHGIDSRDGNKLWQNDIMKGSKNLKGPDGKKLGASAVFDQNVNLLSDPNEPYISDFIEIKYSDNVQFKNFAIINIQTGEEVISPRKADMPVTKFFGKEMPSFNFGGSGFVGSAGGAIISSTWVDYATKGQPTMKMTKFLDLPSGELRWETDQIGLDALPMLANDNNLILPGKERIAKVEAKSGKIIWSYDVSEKKQTFEKFDVSLDLTTGYFFEKKKNNGQLIALNLDSGNPIWSVEYKLKEIPQMFAVGDGVVVVDSKFFSFYDLQSGDIKWETKIKDINYVVDVGPTGIAVAAKDKRLMLLDRSNGSLLWDEKVKGINIDQMIAKGIMYTDEKGRLGIITYDGEKVWAKKGMLPTPSTRYRVAFDKELMYAEGDLYQVDLAEGTYDVLKSKISKEFKDDQEPESIELVEGGYLLGSANNLMMLEPSGSVRWHQHWRAPGMSMAAKIALRTLQVAAVAMAASASAQSAQAKYRYGSIPMDNYYSKMYAQQAEDWLAAAGAAGAEAKKKFTATKEKGDIKVILSLVGQGGQKNASGLVKVDKTTGEELGSIQLSDKEPIYDFDPISGQVFHKASKKQIISYSF